MNNRNMRRWSIAACVLTWGATSQAPAIAQDGEHEEDDTSGAAQACLNHPTIRRTRVLNDRNIVFTTRDGKIYNNQLPRQCPSLRRGSLVNYGIEHSRLCAGSSFQVLWEISAKNYTPAFVCQLGAFIPITEGELEDLVAMTEPDRTRPRRRSAREAVTTEQVELPREQAAPAADEAAAAE
jgi:hypothetical protein